MALLRSAIVLTLCLTTAMAFGPAPISVLPAASRVTASSAMGVPRRWVVSQARVDEPPAGEEGVADASAEGNPEGATAESPPENDQGSAAEAGPEGESAAPPLDPEVEKLKEEIRLLETDVTNARFQLNTAKSKLEESGKTGYARLAATVADFKRKAADGSKFEKEVAALKVAKSFQPVLSAFEAAPEVVPAGHDEAAKTLHGSYQALYRSMELTFAKQGLESFHAVVGEPFDPNLHDRATGPDADKVLAEKGAGAAPSTVVWELAEGKRMKAGVIRRALVAVAPSADSAPAAEAPPAAETPAAEAAADATPPSEP